jgi:mRNA interferase MazF
VPKSYIPDAGDIVWLEFDPQAGREQAGHRPSLVLSPASYNDKVSLAVCCPISTKVKGYPFEVAVETGKTTSVVLSDQVKSLDWRERKAKFKSKISPSQLRQVRENIKALLSIG